jgi:hypothetical protein
LYSRGLTLLKNSPYFLSVKSPSLKQEIEICLPEVEKFCRIYETMFLLGSFSEELKLFISRLYTYPQKNNWKQALVKNSYDTENRLREDLNIIINNYVIILEALEEYPEWKEKFQNEVTKQFAFMNIQRRFPEVYSLIQQQKLFK